MLTWKQFMQAVLTATATDSSYTAPTLTAARITQASAWNPSGAPVAVKIFIMPSAGAAGDATDVWAVTVPAGQSVSVPQVVGHTIPAGYKLQATGAGVTLTISGNEYVAV